MDFDSVDNLTDIEILEMYEEIIEQGNIKMAAAGCNMSGCIVYCTMYNYTYGRTDSYSYNQCK